MIKFIRCFTNPVPPEDDCHNNGRRHFSCLSLQLALLPPAVQFISHFILRLFSVKVTVGLPWWLCGKEPAPQRRRQKRRGFDLWVRKIPWRRKWQPTPVFLPGESHEQRNISCHINKQEMSEPSSISGLQTWMRLPNLIQQMLPPRPPWWLLRRCVVSSLSCVQLCDPMDCSTPGFPFPQHLPELAQTHVHWFGDAIQPSNLLSSPSLPDFNLSQHQGLFQWVSSSHQVAKVLELQYQSFQWIFRVDFL